MSPEQFSNEITRLCGVALKSGMPAELVIGVLEVRKLAVDRFVVERMANQSPIVPAQAIPGIHPNGN